MNKLLLLAVVLLMLCSCQKELTEDPLPAGASIKIELTNIRDVVLSEAEEYWSSYTFGSVRAEKKEGESVTILTPKGEYMRDSRLFPVNCDTIQLSTHSYHGWDYKLVTSSAGFVNQKAVLIDQVTRMQYDITSYTPTSPRRFSLAYNVTSPQESREDRFIIIIKAK